MDINGYAVISGAGSGIGKQSAIAYAASGAAGVALLDINLAAAQETEKKCQAVATKPVKTLSLGVDIGNESEVEAAFARVVGSFGRIDYGLNSAGVGVQLPAEIAGASLKEFEDFLKINVVGSFLFVRCLSKIMKEQSDPELSSFQGDHTPRNICRGSIILLGSCSSLAATPSIVQYVASKHAVLGIVRTAALDNAPYRIRVNCLCPSWVEGPMIDRAVEGNPELEATMKNSVPFGRLAQAQEISDAVLFLSSPRASYINGIAFTVDAGTTLNLAI